MSKSIFGTMVVAVLILFVECTPPPPVRPALSQTVVVIQRHSSKTDAGLPMSVYIDDTKSNYSVNNGESVAIPVNDGVHYIFVEVGKNRSETLNFTAAQKTVSFVASVEGGWERRPQIIPTTLPTKTAKLSGFYGACVAWC